MTILTTRRKKKLTAKRLIVGIITFKWLFLGLIRLYKTVLSPVMGRGCIYSPTCSTYTYEYIEEYGVARGLVMGGLRIARCNPMAKGGFDPVPDNPRGDMKWLF